MTTSILTLRELQALFGETPDPVRRYESTEAILAAHRKRLQELAQCWCRFDSEGKRFHAGAYDQDLLDAYLAYYLTVNVEKLQLLLLELLRTQSFPARFTLMDLGVAAGTTFIAVLDFLAAWNSVCALFQTRFPVERIDFIGVDANRLCLDNSRENLFRMASTLDQAQAFDTSMFAWVEAACWQHRDLAKESPPVPHQPTVLICSNVLSEIGYDAQDQLATLMHGLPEQSLILLLEPGDQRKTQALNQWRDRLLGACRGLQLLSPCGMEYGREVPPQCQHCWNARRESLHRPALYEGFCTEVARISVQERVAWLEEHENHLLSWSYLCLARSGQAPLVEPLPIDTMAIQTRFIGRYRSSGKHYSVALPHLDLLENEHGTIEEKIKFCPANCQANKTALTLNRQAGFILPPLRFGQAVRLEGIEPQPTPYSFEQQVSAQAVVPREATLTATAVGNLDVHVNATGEGLDAVAHRLFGFPSLRDFQRQVIARILTGRSTFAIAATGGGKSECYILPAMLLPGLTVVISPLKSLMQDQYDQRLCARYGLGSVATAIHSGISYRERENRVRRLELGYYKLVYLTPEQCARGQMLDSLQRADDAVGLRLLAIDEAHCISHWGHDFRPAYLNLLPRFDKYGLAPVRLALTATASPQVRRDICDELRLNPDPIEQGGDVLLYAANRPELNLIVRVVDTVDEKVRDIEDRLQRLCRDNQHNRHPGAAIVFMPHAGSAEARATDFKGQPIDHSHARSVAPFASHLERILNRRVGIYHSNLDDEADDAAEDDSEAEDRLPDDFGEIHQRNRRTEQERFIRGDTDIMVATKGFGMGIDKPNIRLVLHHTTPGNLEAYTQEAGRAGRDGDLADAVLYFTPQPVRKKDTERGQSDGEVQRFFLDQKYIREDDAWTLLDFLTQRLAEPDACHQPGRLYVTADEIIGHFDQLASRAQYRWPEFPPRQARGQEFGEHREILDRGHDYQQRIALVDRILSVCYRMRPEVAGRRRALFDNVTQVGAEIRHGRVLQPDSILNSNQPFADVLCAHDIGKADLNRFFCSDRSLFPLAERLELSLRDTAALLWDIKKADGHWQSHQRGQRKWQPALLDFSTIAVPRRGPAAGKDSLSAWRDYAGASKRATKREVEKRAQQASRNRPELDDWFYWPELPAPKGWEITLGEVALHPELIEDYLEALIEMHNQRRDEDNRAYQLLLRDYIGVNESGRSVTEKGSCLRVVLLGYLKTNETVLDGQCGACSVCCPDEQFATDLEWRQQRIVQLSPVLIHWLARFEPLTQRPPATEDLTAFWRQVSAEELAGRAVTGYLRGWTNRLISETPSHVTAYWLRLDGMLRTRFVFDEREFLSDIHRVRALTADPDDLARLAAWLRQAEPLITSEQARLALVSARLFERQQRHADARTAWLRLIEQAQQHPQWALEAQRALAALSAPNKPLESPEHHHLALLGALNLAPDTALETLRPWLSNCRFSTLLALVWDAGLVQPEPILEHWFHHASDVDLQNVLEDTQELIRHTSWTGHASPLWRALEPHLIDVFERQDNHSPDVANGLCQLEALVSEHNSHWIMLAANTAETLSQPELANEYWMAFLALAKVGALNDEQGAKTFEAIEALLRLRGSEGALPDTEAFQTHFKLALELDPERAATWLPCDIHVTDLFALLRTWPRISWQPILHAWLGSARCEFTTILTELDALLEDSEPHSSDSLLQCELLAALLNPDGVLLQASTRLDPDQVRERAEAFWTKDCWRRLPKGTGLTTEDLMWSLFARVKQMGVSVIGRITRGNKGGYDVDLGGLRAFLPKSQSGRLSFQETTSEWDFEFLVLDCEPTRNLVVSRTALGELRCQSLRVGDTWQGRIIALADFGAFVDLGGFDVLLRKSRLDIDPQTPIADILHAGQLLDVTIRDIDCQHHRVGLDLNTRL